MSNGKSALGERCGEARRQGVQRGRLSGMQSDHRHREGGCARSAALEHCPGGRVQQPRALQAAAPPSGSWRRARPSTFRPGLLSPFQVDTWAWRMQPLWGLIFLLPFPLTLLPPLPITSSLLSVTLPSSQPTQPAFHWSASGKCSEQGNKQVH